MKQISLVHKRSCCVYLCFLAWFRDISKFSFPTWQMTFIIVISAAVFTFLTSSLIHHCLFYTQLPRKESQSLLIRIDASSREKKISRKRAHLVVWIPSPLKMIVRMEDEGSKIQVYYLSEWRVGKGLRVADGELGENWKGS